jgi:hypothetical protein
MPTGTGGSVCPIPCCCGIQDGCEEYWTFMEDEEEEEKKN